MIANGHVVGDGSWDLRVFVTDLQTERLIRVKGDVHIGGVMLRLVEDLGISNPSICNLSTKGFYGPLLSSSL
ncbi:unnamed protein product [Callosobruchus maculatus]|uniref:Kindlin-2 N-terminal domain-containing protein n=1 Tax=Callosobruchus maculatus TaxID=64391 RepID=A0A653DLX3_CALMS|nr:unnamed protein product [Callosobruchus maculatus]